MSSSAVAFLSNFGILGLTIVGLYILFLVMRVFLRRLPTDLPLVALNISRGPVLLLVCFVGLNLLLTQLKTSLDLNVQPVTIELIQRGLSSLCFLIISTY